MKTVFASMPLPKSIFLAGPTPRDENVLTWRKEAIDILEKLNFTGSVLIPEGDDWTCKNEYTDQITWEWEALNMATSVVFWVPRELENMPGFTTNIEYGLLAASSKCLLGYPTAAPKMKYLDFLGQRFHIPVYHSLEDILKASVERCEKPFGLPHLEIKG